jgi:iron complex outermembrane recepter protein
VSFSYKLSPNFELNVAGRNIFNAPDVIYSNVESRVRQYSIYGSMWNIGIKGSF